MSVDSQRLYLWESQRKMGRESGGWGGHTPPPADARGWSSRGPMNVVVNRFCLTEPDKNAKENIDGRTRKKIQRQLR